MKITFIGTGSAFTIGHNYQSNMLIEGDNGERMLFDCGSDARRALHHLGIHYRDITHVYISHLHADHVGGLEWLGFSRFFDPTCDTAELFASKDLINDMWEHCLSAGMHSLEEREAQLKTFFKVHEVGENQRFQFSGNQFELVATQHVYNNHQWVPCYGLIFECNDKHVYITSDTQFTPDTLMPYYKKADVIFQDCETADYASGVHAHFNQLCQLPDEIKAKMWLYHYQPGELPDALSEGFCGFVTPGQTFEP